MSGSANIKAGAAFVEIYVKNNMFTRGLQTAQDKLNKFKSFGDNVVGKLAGFAGLIATPVALAVKEFTELGRSLVEGAAKTGTTVEQLDAMHFAAEQSGVGAETLDAALVKLNRTAATSPDKLEKLGISAKEFTDLPLEDKMAAVAESIKDLKDDTQRTAAVMDIFGKAGAGLLPMLKKGASGIKEATAEAERLGLVMSGEDAEKAAELGKSFDKLQAVVKRTFMQLAAALLPVFESIRAGIEDKIGKLQVIGQIIRKNGDLIQSALKVAKTILKVAAAWVALRFAITQLQTGMSLVQTLFGALGSILGFILSPIALVAAAIVGLSALIAYFATDGQIITGLGEAFDGIGERFREVWGDMKDALQQGDLATAARMGWLAVQRELLRIWKPIRLAWSDVIDFFGDGWDSLISVAEGAWNGFVDFLDDSAMRVLDAITNPILDAIKIIQNNTRELRAWLEKQGISTFHDIDTEAYKKAAAVVAAKQREKVGQDRADRDKKLSADLEAKRDARKDARGAKADELDKDIADIEAQIQDVKNEIAKAKNAAFAGKVISGVLGMFLGSGNAVRTPASAALAESTKGTFSGSADARSLAIGDSMGKKQDRTNELLDDIKGELQDGGTFGP